jgi:hypothetical protein
VEDRELHAWEVLDTDRAKSLGSVLGQITETLHRLARQSSLRLEECAGITVAIAALVD